LIFRSPNIGQAVTLVEAIHQLLLNPENRILACAPGNSAAALLARQLSWAAPRF
ncbi:hypothetical protein C8J56DRAFT_769490, partial [Mycena floridula]